jgi:hypothetical protein
MNRVWVNVKWSYRKKTTAGLYHCLTKLSARFINPEYFSDISSAVPVIREGWASRA